ncbi:hypothetical protein [Bdellovibrio sp. HCB337]|uniref:hypothetical protein n=1 Tax=Bdellovibrio sp. HCB337 TaxID=3394358 RepID=UPI0039A43562
MRLASNKLLTLSLGLSLVGNQSFAQSTTTKAAPTTTSTSDISILPLSGPNMNDVVVDSQMSISRSNGDTTNMDITVYCYGTNLRGVSNPVSPASNIIAKIQYQAGDRSYKWFRIKFPATAISKTESLNMDLTPTSTVSTDPEGATVTDKFTAHIRDSNIRVAMKRTRAIGLDLLSAKEDFGKLTDLDGKTNLIKSIQFDQELPEGTPPQQFMGWSGPLTAGITWYASENGKQIKIMAGFPGENGFCGGYFSPLVLKFAVPENPPGISKNSHFPLYTSDLKLPKGPPKISWPDFKEETFFLALDKDENGKIDNGSELFGDINGFEDGFKNLAFYDSNKDNIIDEKDKVFSSLKLWNDKNGDGRCQKSEVKKISDMGVSSISLTYINATRFAGNSGKILGPGEFSYKDKKGNIVKGSVWDIFLTGVP